MRIDINSFNEQVMQRINETIALNLDNGKVGMCIYFYRLVELYNCKTFKGRLSCLTSTASRRSDSVRVESLPAGSYLPASSSATALSNMPLGMLGYHAAQLQLIPKTEY
jgi:hypothetical protein